LAKIAVDVANAVKDRQRVGGPGRATRRTLARGDDWSVEDIVCTSGPQDEPFEEVHTGVSIAMVAAGTFQYRTTTGRELMTPGSLLLGDAGQAYECGHEHGVGDRCIAFQFSQDYFERITSGLAAGARKQLFTVPRLAPLRVLSPLVARACAGLTDHVATDWEELGIRVAARVIQSIDGSAPKRTSREPHAVARVTRVVRMIEEHSEGPLTLSRLANESGLSPYHFLRVFQQITGVTPHQYLLRMRLRAAALRVADAPHRVLDIALDCGFWDISNFNRTFRAEFGVSPLVYRKLHNREHRQSDD
jgi:AraC family transcriptional regulator